jgi:cytochrome oxidase Cu insertion factor (SCO1/SenC/PrrC family)
MTPHASKRFLLPGIAVVCALLLAGAGLWMWHAATRTDLAPPPPAAESLPPLGAVPEFSLVERSGRPATLADLRNRVWVADFVYTTCTDTCPLQTARMAALQAEFAAEPDFRLVSISVDPDRDTVAVLRKYADRFAADRDRWLFLTGSQATIYALVRDGFKLDVEDVRKSMEAHPVPAKRGKPGKPAAAAPDGKMRMAIASRLSAVAQAGARSAGKECGMTDGLTVARLADRAARSLFAPATAFAHSNHDGSPVVHSSRFALIDRRGQIRGYYLSDDDEAQTRLRRDIRTLLREPRS